jgi:mono/diheme cytochrome c family protein
MNRVSRNKKHGPLAILCAAALFAGIVAYGDDPPAAPPEWKAPARAAKKKNPVPTSDASVAAGLAIYGQQCLACHGPTGGGDGPKSADLTTKPRNLREAKIQEQTDGAIFWKLSTGKTPMPVFEKLLPDENDRWNVINYVRTFGPPPTTQSTSQPPAGAN